MKVFKKNNLPLKLQEEDSVFAGLICSGASLIKFYQVCLSDSILFS